MSTQKKSDWHRWDRNLDGDQKNELISELLEVCKLIHYAFKENDALVKPRGYNRLKDVIKKAEGR